MSNRFNPAGGRLPTPALVGFPIFSAGGRSGYRPASGLRADPAVQLRPPKPAATDLDETMAAPLWSDASDTPMDTMDDEQLALVEAWLPLQDPGDMPFVGQSAYVTLAGRGRSGFSRIDGIVIAVLSDRAGVGRGKFSHVQILTDTAFFMGGNTYHPLVCGVAVQVSLATESGSLDSILATVQAWPD